MCAVTYRKFADRRTAGRRLAGWVRQQDWTDPVVLGLARGGVPVAAEVARELDAPLDVAVSRKIGAPGRPEFGVGAVTADGPPYYDDRIVRMLRLDPRDLEQVCADQRAEARRRVRRYLRGREPVALRGRDVLVVDDGLATGVTATAALRDARQAQPRRLVFAAPVCAPEAAEQLRGEVDDLMCLAEPDDFAAVGQWYDDFAQTSDNEVVSFLRTAR